MTETEQIYYRRKYAAICYNHACVYIMQRDNRYLPPILDAVLKPRFIERCLPKLQQPNPADAESIKLTTTDFKDLVMFMDISVKAYYFIKEMEL